MRDNVKAWYLLTYPHDELGKELPDNVTFKDYFEYLDSYRDIYELMGVAADSIIRERIFERLAEIMDCDYEYIYEQWLKGV